MSITYIILKRHKKGILFIYLFILKKTLLAMANIYVAFQNMLEATNILIYRER